MTVPSVILFQTLGTIAKSAVPAAILVHQRPASPARLQCPFSYSMFCSILLLDSNMFKLINFIQTSVRLMYMRRHFR